MADTDPAEVTKIANQVMSDHLETMVRILALQLALVRKGILGHEEIEAEVAKLNSLPGIQAIRSKFGTPTLDIDELLRDYRGTVQ